MYKPKIYTASKLHHATLWRTLRNDPDWEFAEFTARWIDFAEELEDNHITTELLREAWIHDVNDIKTSDFVLLYAGGELGLKGALVEVGIGIGIGLTIVAVGLPADQTWAHHPLVRTFPSLREARLYLFRFTVMAPPSARKKGLPANE